MLIDTHCHLDAPEFDADREAVLADARRAGVERFVVPAVDEAGIERVVALADRHADVYFALGIHPMYVDAARDEALVVLRDALLRLADHPRLIAIGEIGLDYFVPGLDHARQQRFLEAQLRMARDFDLPVILHSRRAVDAIAAALRRFRPRAGVAHAFNGSEQQARQLHGLGLTLGFGGAMTFSRAKNIRRLAGSLPIEALVLETDAPDIAPAWLHPERNTPLELPRIAAELAMLRGLDVQTVIRATGENAGRSLPGITAADGRRSGGQDGGRPSAH